MLNTESQRYDIATTLLILQDEYEPEPVIEWNEKASSIPMFNRAMAAFKPVPADYVCHYPLPKVKRKKTDGLCNSFSATYLISLADVRNQKKQERMIRDMGKIKAKHELSEAHEVDFITFIRDDKTWATLTIKRSA